MKSLLLCLINQTRVRYSVIEWLTSHITSHMFSNADYAIRFRRGKNRLTKRQGYLEATHPTEIIYHKNEWLKGVKSLCAYILIRREAPGNVTTKGRSQAGGKTTNTATIQAIAWSPRLFIIIHCSAKWKYQLIYFF